MSKRKTRAINDADWRWWLACGLILLMSVAAPWVILISRAA